MCGILGIVGKNKVKEGLELLKRLEYRGYDSFGFANNKIIYKQVGSIDFSKIKKFLNIEDNVFVGHTRWATHGEVNEINAHPHFDCTREIKVVHNGIIENYEEIKESLKGHKFYSNTDTEVIAHFIEENLKKMPMEDVIEKMFDVFEGYYAILVQYRNKLYAIKKDEPLIVGFGDKIYISSDLYSIKDKIDEFFVLDDYEYAKFEI